MILYEVIKQFTDIDNQIKTVGQIIEAAENRATKLIERGFIVPIPQEAVESLLNTINRKLSVVDGKIGEPTDFPSLKDTVLAYSNAGYQHIHQPAKCYPTLADGIAIAGGVAAWTLGDFVELIPAETITTPFDIHYVNVEEASANDVYELVLYSGLAEAETEIGRIRTLKATNQTGANSVQIQVPVQHANARISAKLASKTGSDSLTVSVFYHQYS